NNFTSAYVSANGSSQKVSELNRANTHAPRPLRMLNKARKARLRSISSAGRNRTTRTRITPASLPLKGRRSIEPSQASARVTPTVTNKMANPSENPRRLLSQEKSKALPKLADALLRSQIASQTPYTTSSTRYSKMAKYSLFTVDMAAKGSQQSVISNQYSVISNQKVVMSLVCGS